MCQLIMVDIFQNLVLSKVHSQFCHHFSVQQLHWAKGPKEQWPYLLLQQHHYFSYWVALMRMETLKIALIVIKLQTHICFDECSWYCKIPWMSLIGENSGTSTEIRKKTMIFKAKSLKSLLATLLDIFMISWSSLSNRVDAVLMLFQLGDMVKFQTLDKP